MRKYVKPASCDPKNSVSLFDADRKNEFGEMYCVAPAILQDRVDSYWADYVAHSCAAANAARLHNWVRASLGE